jgi:cell division protein FtsB
MLGRKKKKKTGAQIAHEITESISTKVILISRHSLSMRIVCTACIVIFSFSIAFGIYGLASRMGDISKREHNIEKLKTELQDLGKQLEKKQKLRDELINDTLAIEAVARSYGMSKKGEKAFYFLD